VVSKFETCFGNTRAETGRPIVSDFASSLKRDERVFARLGRAAGAAIIIIIRPRD